MPKTENDLSSSSASVGNFTTIEVEVADSVLVLQARTFTVIPEFRLDEDADETLPVNEPNKDEERSWYYNLDLSSVLNLTS